MKARKRKDNLLTTTWNETFDILNESKEVVGECVINEQHDRITIYKLNIFQCYRRKGYATKFIKHLIDKYNKHITLAVSVDNYHAKNLYYKLGFVVTFRVIKNNKGWLWLMFQNKNYKNELK